MLPILVLAAAAAVPAPAAPPAPPIEARVEVPSDRGLQEVRVQRRDIAVAGASGWHTHPGTEIGLVISGVTEMRTARGASRYAAGDTFVIERGTVHNGVNIGKEAAVMVVTYVIDSGKPVRADAPEPASRR